MDSHRKGDLIEAIVVAKLKHRNIPVSVPFGDNERYDLIIQSPEGELLRAQVKSGRFRDGTVRFDGISQSTNTKGNTYRSYEGEVDCFLVYSIEVDSLYFIRTGEFNTSMALRIEQPETNHPSINWADDFEFDRRWGSLFEVSANQSENLPTHQRGDATEAIVVAELLQREIPLAMPPSDNERYDLLAGTAKDRFFRIQIKTGWIDNDVIHFQPCSSHTNTQGNVRKPYDGDVDYFIIFVPELESLYLIAEDEFNTGISLRIQPPKGVHRDINWADDFEFDRNWPPAHRSELNIQSSWYQRELLTVVIDSLLERNIPVARSLEPASDYDLLLETPQDGIARTAVRTVNLKDRRLTLTTEENCDSGFDYFILYCHTLDQLYLVSDDSFETSISLWIDEPKEIQRTTKWAEDFEFDQNWPPDIQPTVSRKSTIGEGIAAFEALGAEVAYPCRDELPYDILVGGRETEYLRVAVEPGWPSKGCLRLKPVSCAGIDAFLVVCRSLGTEYLVDAAEFDRSISLRVEPPDKPDPSINPAGDFELRERWPPD